MFTDTYGKKPISHDEHITEHNKFMSIDKEHNVTELYIKIHDYYDEFDKNISVYAVIAENGRCGTGLFNDKDVFARYCHEDDEFYDIEKVEFLNVGYRFK